MRTTVALIVLSLAVCAGCAGSPGPTIATVACARLPGINLATLSGESGVYRAGGLTLVTGQDLAQDPGGGPGEPAGSEVIALVTGGRPVTVRNQRGSRVRVGLQFDTSTPGHPDVAPSAGRPALRFPACGSPRHAFFGGVALTGRGCARLSVDSGQHTRTMLIPVGNTLSGCPPIHSRNRLPSASLPFLGVGCGRPDWFGCGRVGVGVSTETPAILVVVQLAGRLVALSAPAPPQRPTVWQGYLLGASLRHGPLRIPVAPRQDFWYGSPEVHPRVRVIAFFPNGQAASATGSVLLHPGFG
jgi:hypothetical protein